MARSLKTPIGLYYYFISSLFILTASVNIRYRHNKELDAHVGGADFAAPLFLFAFLLAIPLIPKVISNLKITTNRNTLLLFFALFFLPTVVGVLNAPLPEYSYIELVRQSIVFIMVCFFTVILYFTSVKWIYYSLAILVLAQALAVVVQITGVQIPFIATQDAHFLNENISRFAGIQGHPNILAGLMNIVAVFMLAGLFYDSILPRKFFLIFYILSSVLVLLTLSRAGLAVLAGSSLYLIVFGSGRNLFAKKYLAYTGLLGLGIVFFIFFGEGFEHRIFDGISSNVTSRFTLNSVAFSAFLENPVVGAGSNNFIYFAQDYDSSALTKYWKAPVHNLFLLYMSESGSIGIVAFLSMLWLLFMNFRTRRNSNNRKAVLLSSGAEAALVSILIGSLFGYFYRQDIVQPILALIFAIGLCRFQVASPARQRSF